MRLKAIKEEAAKLVREMGSDALEVAELETLKAKRQKNHRLELYKGQVALEVSRQMRSKVI
jgi:hypothetical protein